MGWTRYYLSLGLIGGLLFLFVVFIRVAGKYYYPPAFWFFRRLFSLQYAFFTSAVLAAILWSFRGGGARAILRSVLLAIFYFLFAWIALWTLVERSFGIELDPPLIITSLFTAAPISEMGVARSELIVTLAAVAIMIILATVLTNRVARHVPSAVRRKAFILFAGCFLLLHVPVRTYFAWQIAHNDYAILAVDDCIPFPLRTEQLWPGGHSGRLTMPNYASAAQLNTYLPAVERNENVRIPHPAHILFLNIESLRFDAVTEATMPRLSSFRHSFQLQAEKNHWSSANATHRAIFSMLTGLSGYYVSPFHHAGVSSPFLELLLHNGYRVRYGKKAHLESSDLPDLVPLGAIVDDVPIGPDLGDSQMVDRYLDDSHKRPAQPSFDFLPFDATHWPYHFTTKDAIFQPAPNRELSEHALFSQQDLTGARNRYKDACHGVDFQIGRVLDDFERRGGFRNSIVIVAGDHGEEFEERGQITHSAVFNDFQGRTILWMHFPDGRAPAGEISQPTTHLDIVPTLLDALGFKEDVLYTQGRSLLEPVPARPLLSFAQQGGMSIPIYRSIVSPNYISNWRYGPEAYRFCAIQRRDGGPVQSAEWINEVRQGYERAAHMYDILPDVSQGPPAFATGSVAHP
jgi:membrane-anchored protein YejM (alkaline phosphatase superfamily)